MKCYRLCDKKFLRFLSVKNRGKMPIYSVEKDGFSGLIGVQEGFSGRETLSDLSIYSYIMGNFNTGFWF